MIPIDFIVPLSGEGADDGRHLRLVANAFAQAEALKEMLAKRGTQVHAMLELSVPDEMLMERLINRGKTSGRADDNEETIGKRLAVYHNQTSPLIEWYEKEGLRNAVKGHGALEEINAALCAVIDVL